MDNLLKEKKSIGVIVCRMQVPFLTDSHRKLIETVINRHERIIIFLGTTNKGIDSRNPFPFEFRKQMLECALPSNKITIIPLPDNDDNAIWVNVLDTLITSFLTHDETALLYGGRDSFIPYYKKDNGKFDSVELSPQDYDSGTQLRTLSSIPLPKYTTSTAEAILWTLRQIEK